MLQFSDPTPRITSAYRQLVRHYGSSGLAQDLQQKPATAAAAYHQHFVMPQEQAFVVAELLAEYFNASSGASSNKAFLALLSAAIDDAAQRRNYIGLLADCLEGAGVSSAAATTEASLTELFGGSKLSVKPRSMVCFFVALCHSSNGDSRAMGCRLLAQAIKNAGPRFSSFVAMVDNSLLMQQVATIAVEEPRTFGANGISQSCAALRAQVDFQATALAQHEAKERDNHGLQQLTGKGRLLAKQIVEVGPVCMATEEDAKALLDLHPGLSDGDIARALLAVGNAVSSRSTMTPKQSKAAAATWAVLKASVVGGGGWQAAASALLSSQHQDPADGSASSQQSGTWNVAALAAALKEKRQGTMWNTVLRSLDQPEVCAPGADSSNNNPTAIVLDDATMDVVATVYRKATGANAVPLSCFLGTWTHPGAQWAALRCIIAQPELVDRKQMGNSAVVADSLLNAAAAAASANGAVSPFWRVVDFAAAVVDAYDCRSRNEVNAFIQQSAKCAPAVVAAALAACRPSRSTAALPILRGLLEQHGTALALPHESLSFIDANGAMPFLLTVLADVVTRDTGRLASLMPALQSRRLFGKFLDHIAEPRVAALVALSGVEAGELTASIFADMVQSPQRPIASRTMLASAIVEVCDELLAKNSSSTPSPSLRAAISSVANAQALTAVIPSVVQHAAVLISSSDNDGAAGAASLLSAASADHGGDGSASGAAGAAEAAAATAGAGSSSKKGDADINAPSSRAIISEDGTFPADIETAAVQFLESVCQSSLSESDAVGTCDNFARSNDHKDLLLLGCIIMTMLEEARCIGDYPVAERRRFATLFGHLIDRNLLPKAQLQKALVIVLQSMLPVTGADGKPGSVDPKTQDFGATALSVFKRRLHEWPALAKQIRMVQNVDMLVPGIISLLDRPQREAQLAAAAAAQAGRDAEADSASAGSAVGGASSASGDSPFGGPSLGHVHDISVLKGALPQSSSGPALSLPPIVPPSSVVQDRINFLVSNTDPNNLDNNAAELASLVKPETFPYFAEYMIVRRVSLETNNHKMYVQLLSKFENAELDRQVRLAAIIACKRVMASEGVRNASNERSLLKALGAWLGLTTLARNQPVLARELDMLELVPRGIVEGKLIAVVPFIARVLEGAGSSRAFAVPNPWLLSLLSQLVEMYSLPELKITLRFEVEVLCRNLNVSIDAIADYMKVNPKRWNLLELKQRYVDVNNSFDFKPSQDDQFVSKKLTPDAPEFRPRTGVGSPAGAGVAGMSQAGPSFMNSNSNQNNNNSMNNNGPQGQQGQLGVSGLQINPNQQQQAVGMQQQSPGQLRAELRAPAELMANVPQHLRETLRGLLVQAGEAAFREVMQAADRPMAIAMVCARDMALKDFCHDPDHGTLVTAAKITARSLTTHLIAVSLRDTLVAAIRKAAANALQRLGVADQGQINAEAENIMRENTDRMAALVDEATAEAAQRHVADYLAQSLEERQRVLQVHGSLASVAPPHTEQWNAPNLPEALRPRGSLGPAHRAVYEDFRNMLGSLRNPRDQILSLMRDIELDAGRHYQVMPPSPATNLSLTKPEFTSTSLSEYHLAIRQKLVEFTKMVEHAADYNLGVILETAFKCLVDYSESPGMRRPPQQPGQPQDPQMQLAAAVAPLLMEVGLFTLQKLRDKFNGRVQLEITKMFFAHERRWQLREAATSLGRLVFFDFAEFDEQLAAALRETASTSHSADRTPVVEFASHFLQRILIESKTANASDLSQTLTELQKIAAAKHPTAVRIPSTFGHDEAGRAARGELETVFREWLEICEKRNSDATQQQPSNDRQRPVLNYIQKLQSLGLLKVDRGGDTALERFFSALTEIVVEDYATQLMLLERENMGRNNSNNNSNNNSGPGGNKTGPSPRAPTADPKLFASADAFSDLVSVLVKCCTWSTGQTQRINQAPEVALVTKVLSVVAKVLRHNHNYFAEEKRQPLPLPDNVVMQDSFMQQPYLRVLSNLLMHLGPMPPALPASQQGAVAAASAGDGKDAVSAPAGSKTADSGKDEQRDAAQVRAEQAQNTVLEFFNVIALTLHTSLNPMQVPGFAFAWIELLCHRIFVARLLSHNQRGWDSYFRMLADAVKFADTLAQANISSGGGPPSPSSALFYRCLLKVLVLLLHDFPDFLLLYHQPLCDLIPSGWVQLRNVVLSSFPKQVKLPDPFSATLQLDQLPEIARAPPMLEYHRDCFKDTTITKAAVDAFMATGSLQLQLQQQPARGGGKQQLQQQQPHQQPGQDLLTPALFPKLKNATTGKWNTTLINGLVLYVGIVQAEKRAQQRKAELAAGASALGAAATATTAKPEVTRWSIADTPAMEVLQYLVSHPSNELRSIVVNACANQLRFPNSHTHFYSMALLALYLYGGHDQQDQVQEIIVRVLLERIVIVRPQPWGLLITFFEIVKSPLYDLQNKPFIRCTPEIERTFEGIFERLVTGPQSRAAAAAAAAQQQQQQQQQQLHHQQQQNAVQPITAPHH